MEIWKFSNKKIKCILYYDNCTSEVHTYCTHVSRMIGYAMEKESMAWLGHAKRCYFQLSSFMHTCTFTASPLTSALRPDTQCCTVVLLCYLVKNYNYNYNNICIHTCMIYSLYSLQGVCISILLFSLTTRVAVGVVVHVFDLLPMVQHC